MPFSFDENARIRTQRLLLRKFCLSDIGDMLKNWISDSEVQSGYGEPVFTTEPEVIGLLAKWEHQYRWAVILAENGENIGHVSFCRLYEETDTAEIEYCIGKAFWGNGYAAEAVRAFISHTFHNTAIMKLEAFHRSVNPASGRVLQKSGLLPARNVTRFSHLAEAPDGKICYAISREEFNGRDA